MSIYYVYQLIDPRNGKPFYVGKGSCDRAHTHAAFKDGNNNPHKDRLIRKLQSLGLEPRVTIVIDGITDEASAYALEEDLIESIGLANLTNICSNAAPPNKQGWKPSKETLAKRSENLKGIPRTTDWRKKLSDSKKGKNNPQFGKTIPCSKERRASIARSKNKDNFEKYKQAIDLLNAGNSVDSVSKELGIGLGICFRLKNRSHGIFLGFPELV